jgi:hypothetical protein
MSDQSHDHSGSGTHGPHETLPHVGKPLDGSQYRNIIEEQIYSELPPTTEEQEPLLARHLAENKDPAQKQPVQGASLSVGIN